MLETDNLLDQSILFIRFYPLLHHNSEHLLILEELAPKSEANLFFALARSVGVMALKDGLVNFVLGDNSIVLLIIKICI